MKGKEVRESFLKYFASKNHQQVSSSSLVPESDPTLLFANAGMNQFKNLFLGAEKRNYSRATTAQKCMRISGKHNDLENVGVTARHHTFFEMLGNFSFGDYFKKEAIEFAWEYITEVLKLPEERLWVTIYEDDDEAGELWAKYAKVKRDRILKCGAEDNFWAMGDTGPCGPCSEIHVYLGDDVKAQSEHGFRNTDGVYLEIWNLVFMQFNRDKSGELTPLPKPSIDTGMGLERLTSLMQKVSSNYDTDLLRPIISRVEEISNIPYGGRSFEVKDLKKDIHYAQDVAMRVIADHARAATFLIADGAMPGSDGRGYVLRRLIRRAIRHGRVLNFKDPFFHEASKVVINEFSSHFENLKEREQTILEVLKSEEVKFNETLDSGLTILQKEVDKLSPNQKFSGEVAFMLHDTYGFPVDLTSDALKAFKREVDIEGFNRAMNTQKTRSRQDRKAQGIEFEALETKGEVTNFVGYETLEIESPLSLIVQNKEKEVALMFKETPFYAESGGQISDTGEILFKDCKLEVFDTQKTESGGFVHFAEVIDGKFSEKLLKEKAILKVDALKRREIRAHHSSTHLVHYALRKVLGDHVKQAGSKVTDSFLRFDYSHFKPVSREELLEVQKIANDLSMKNSLVETKVLPIEEARKTGAMALFGEKYGEKVRVVFIGEESIEFCGGTHVTRSGDVGGIFILEDSSISSGVRRIECVASHAALNIFSENHQKISQLQERFKSTDFEEKIEKLFERQKDLETQLNASHQKLASFESLDLLTKKEVSSSGITFVSTFISSKDIEALKTLVDTLRVGIKSGVVILASQTEAGGVIVAGSTSDLSKKINVGNLIKTIATEFGGKGGGRPDFAQAGGIQDVKAALKKLTSQI